jgi:hypothetical protein
MPYFYKPDEVNILYIHIPKTGGTSIEEYMSNRYNISLDERSLYYNLPGISLQHYTYENIIYHPQIILVPGFSTFTIVRNPYHRIISDLFFIGLATIGMSTTDIFEIISNQYMYTERDNHTRPQYEFIYNMSNNILYDHIYVLKSESLSQDIRALGYTDFDIHANKGPIENHMDYLNRDSIDYINRVYALDFAYFGYMML